MTLGIEDHGTVSESSQLCRTCQTRRASADQGDVLSVFFTRLEHIDAVIEHVVDGVPLQTSNLNRLLSFRI
ncbi:MAG: hypothetical protein DMG63_00555 [Acidobacteria bacterium]|nr:MAG: hypothetical protein DMG63_00555 [Acidobacteriota bacterium]